MLWHSRSRQDQSMTPSWPTRSTVFLAYCAQRADVDSVVLSRNLEVLQRIAVCAQSFRQLERRTNAVLQDDRIVLRAGSHQDLPLVLTERPMGLHCLPSWDA